MFDVAQLTDAIKRLADAMKSARRDKREPKRANKEKLQLEVERALLRHFNLQRRALLDRLANVKATQPDFSDLFDDWDGEIERNLIRLFLRGAYDGIGLVGENTDFLVDYTAPNAQALEWARKYAGQLIRDIDKESLATVRQAVATFIDTPGFTLRDIADLLPFGEARAFTIAVTETTRAYSQGQQIARDEIMNRWPDVKVVGTWFTNADDLVCELCGEIDGKEVEGDAEFYDSADDDYQDGFPPLHPNCRCWVDWRTKING